MYNKIIKKIILWILFFTAHALMAADRVTMEDLDNILKKAGSLNAFLESEPLQREYHRLAAEYYGHNFTASERVDSYWKILEQMKIAVKQNPTLGERLWSTQDLGTAFKIESNVRNRGVTLKAEEYQWAWKRYVSEEEKKLNEMPSSGREEFIKNEAKEVAEWIEAEKAKIENSFRNSNLPRSQRESARGQAFAKLQQDLIEQDRFQKLKAALVHELYQKEAFGDILRTGDANIILDFLDKFRAKSTNMFGINGLKSVLETLHPYIIKSMPKELMQPEVPKLIVKDGKGVETEFFRVNTKKVKVRDASGRVVSTKIIPAGTNSGTLELKPIPRRFHGAFKGIELGECVAGGNCAWVSIERWGVPALEGSHHYYVEAGGQYEGWVSLFPGEIDGKRVSNIEFGSNILNQNQEYQGKPYPLYEHVMAKLEDKLPKNSSGFVVGDSNAINNAGVIDKIRKRDSYGLGDKVSATFEHKDQKTLNFLIDERARQNQPEHYAGKGIIDANQSNEANTILNKKLILNDHLDDDELAKIIKEMNEKDPVKSLLGREASKAEIILSRPENINRPGVFEALKDRAKKGDLNAIMVIVEPEHIDRPGVFDIIKKLSLARNGTAIAAISRPENIVRPGVIDILKTLAKDGGPIATRILGNGKNIDLPGVFDFLKEQAQNGNMNAYEIVTKDENINRPGVLEIVKEKAKTGYYSAIATIGDPQHINHPGVLDILKDLVLKNDKYAIQKLVQEGNMRNPAVINVVMDIAKSGNEYAILSIGLSKFKNNPEVFDLIKKLAAKGSRSALSVLAESVDSPEVLEIIMTRAKQGDKNAILILIESKYRDHPNVFEDLIRVAKRHVQNGHPAITAYLKSMTRERYEQLTKAKYGLASRQRDCMKSALEELIKSTPNK
jgi:hypothetical protein